MNPKHTLKEQSFKVDAETIRAYAELSQDFNPIHLDPAFAEKTVVGEVIAHGTIALCLLWKSIAASFDNTVDFGGLSLEVKFIGPVRVDDIITAGGHLQAGTTHRYDVWVQGQDKLDRVTGVLEIQGSTNS